ncbi:hypothetical protein POVWA2_053430 [Plasmodium ovale wallikeri]|uniref:Dynein regulatory complex protein 1 C-terminal domain-containing protein n=1 Tax=Plasmodium ovale wallikeri TaxID=864142 RepID=A0A1A8ZTB5_PLAOA|nr:hypothetical protein POVWA1_054210 [Plasmodium ovale wallikeri]SBT47144.1 hypothetical protein POVWA2_053430 [Plasmodium ovale wallikeri]
MDIPRSTSKERRIEKRRNRIKKKLNGQGEIQGEIQEETSNATSTEKKKENNGYTSIERKEEKDVTYNFEYRNVECDLNYDNLRNDIINNLGEKKKEFIEELSVKIKEEEKPFLENIKKYAVDLEGSNFMTCSGENGKNLPEQLEDIYQSDFQNNIADVKALAMKEKETYKKKIEKYFSLLKYKDEQIKKVCEINSKNISSFIAFMRNQMEGYKVYLEEQQQADTRGFYEDEEHGAFFILFFLKFLSNTPFFVSHFVVSVYFISFCSSLLQATTANALSEKVKETHEQNHLNLEEKNELLENNLNMNMQHIQEINDILMDREKNIYNIKLLQQKNCHNLKMINFYKLEINKLRESLLSVKTYYYNYKIKSKKNISELINQYERIKFQFIELQKRQKSYEQNFQKKYAKAWDLQKSEANKYIEKLISANQIIHEHIFLKKFYKTNYKHLIEDNSSLISTATKEDENLKTELIEKQVTVQQIENVKKLLLQECSFLVDGDIDDEQEKLKKILKYIGVHTQEDLELLTQLFHIDNQEANEDTQKNNRDSEENGLSYNSEYTLDIIFKYYQEKEKDNICRIANNKQKYKNRLNVSLKLIIERKKQEKEYWDKLAQITPDDMIELWKTFLIFVEKYYHTLKERATIIQNIFKEEKLIKENLSKIDKMRESLSSL